MAETGTTQKILRCKGGYARPCLSILTLLLSKYMPGLKKNLADKLNNEDATLLFTPRVVLEKS